MFDSRSRVIRMISFCGVLVSIQGQPHRLISDRMRKNLQAPAIKFCHGLCVLRWIPKQLAGLTWIVTVRREHGRGVRFDHAVQHGLNHTARYPVIVISATSLLDLFDRIRSQLWRVEKVGDVKPQGHLAIAAQFVIKIKPSKSCAALCTRVSPNLLASWIPRRKAASRSSRLGLGMTLATKSPAVSFSAPVASPFSLRTIFPLGGSGVSRVIPAICKALLFAQEL